MYKIGYYNYIKFRTKNPSNKQMIINIQFNNTFSNLPETFFKKVKPTPVKSPSIIILNTSLCEELNLNPKELFSQDGVNILSGNQIPKDAFPLAMAYGGHQFGHWVAQLGDGRAILLGEITGRNNIKYDFQLKGSGITPYSRNGDGRSALGPVIREYLVSESMHHLNIPTTRSLSIVKTGEYVMRDQILPGGILTRISQSHIRVGTFQYFFAKNDLQSLKLLKDYTINRYYKYKTLNDNSALNLLKNVSEKQANLIALWQSIGFIHGVMNTDNTSIIGDTIDYGPCAFMDTYDINTCFSSIDQNGRYAYKNQPTIAQWNLAMLANSLLPLIIRESSSEKKAIEDTENIIYNFEDKYKTNYYNIFRKKIGLNKKKDEDIKIINELLETLYNEKLDFISTLRALSSFLHNKDTNVFEDKNINNLYMKLDKWVLKWKKRLAHEDIDMKQIITNLNKSNPVLIPRNHIIENIIEEASFNENYKPLETYLKYISKPYDDTNIPTEFISPPSDINKNYKTFCGT